MSENQGLDCDDSNIDALPQSPSNSLQGTRRNPRKSPNPVKRKIGSVETDIARETTSSHLPTDQLLMGTASLIMDPSPIVIDATPVPQSPDSPENRNMKSNLQFKSLDSFVMQKSTYAVPQASPSKRQKLDSNVNTQSRELKSLKQTKLTKSLAIGPVLDEKEEQDLENNIICQADLDGLRKENAELRGLVGSFNDEKLKFNRRIAELTEHLETVEETHISRSVVRPLLESWCRKECLLDHRVVREKTFDDFYRLGHFSSLKSSAVWNEGNEILKVGEDINRTQTEIKKLSDRVSALKRACKEKIASPDSDFQPDIHKCCTCSFGNECTTPDCPIASFVTMEQLNFRISYLKSHEKELKEHFKQLESEKRLHMKEVKRIRDEDESDFAIGSLMSGQYLMLKLLGKGGYSEVWHAIDLKEFREVAIKINQIGTTWNAAKRESYVKHVKREFDIHSCLRHKNIVLVYGMIDLPPNGFAMVMEYCGGYDLDHLLRERDTLTEREARSIVIQVVSALLYLNESLEGGDDGVRKAVIHFDLKPGNIMFDSEQNVKISDFGLSKIMDIVTDSSTRRGMELTSAGAGTYWYLPSECFREDAQISDKVDVYSLGVIFYEMLYGKKPIGEGQSQETMVSEETITTPHVIVFPPKPSVSSEAQDFIRSCLQFDQSLRPSVKQIAAHPYLVSALRKN